MDMATAQEILITIFKLFQQLSLFISSKLYELAMVTKLMD